MASMLKAAIQKAEAFRAEVEKKGAWSKEDGDTFTAMLGDIDRAKLMDEKSGELDKLVAEAKASDGKSAVRASYRSAGPTEGDIEGVTEEADTVDGEGNVKHGSRDLFGYDKLGEQKVKTFKSGAYKDAVNSYIRAAGLYGANWQNAMKANHMKVLQEGQDTAGGFFVPVDQRAELIKKMAGITGVKNDVFQFTTGTDLVSFPKIVYTSNPSDDSLSSIFASGTRFTNGPEAPSADISESTNPAAGKILIPIHLQTAAIILTRQLLEDSMFDVLGYITDLMGETMGLQEDYWYINGTGSGQPQGILSHANATVANASGGMYVATGTSAGIGWGDGTSKGVLFAEACLPPQYDAKAKWYATKKTYAALRASNVTTAGIQWGLGDYYPNAQNGYSPALLGHPVVRDQFVPELASSSYSVIFGDVSGYFAPQRVGISVEVFREIKGLRDEVVVYGRRRLGGQLVKDWQVKDMKAATS